MTLEKQIKNYRKQSGMSQEQMADKIGVSRQAVTKWENGTGTPDITNLIAIAELFHISLDELLLNEKSTKRQSDFLYESMTEYDIDGMKNFDVKLGGANTVVLRCYDGEKIKVILSSDTLQRLQSDYKIKIDDMKNRIDVNLQRLNDATEAQMKEELTVIIYFPKKYIGKIEVSVNTKRFELIEIENDIVEIDGKVTEVYMNGCKGKVEINCNLDMIIHVGSFEGTIDINQLSATSKIIVPVDYDFKAVRKGVATSIHYEKQGQIVDDFSYLKAENSIEFNGMKSELIIAREEMV
ncbi:MAG: helix-turn-helix domain-containing protein [Faecalibacillus sp.]